MDSSLGLFQFFSPCDLVLLAIRGLLYWGQSSVDIGVHGHRMRYKNWLGFWGCHSQHLLSLKRQRLKREI